MKTITRSYLELFFAVIFWGFGFVAAIYALPAIGPIWISCFRFLIAVVMIDLFFRFKKTPLTYSWRELKITFWPGFILFLLMAFQTWGLRYTTATRSSFITVLYVLFIPFIERFLLHTPIRKMLWLWVLIALIGTTLICKAILPSGFAPEFLQAFNLGDWFTLVCALANGAHFILISRTLAKIDSPVKFHVFQSLWVVVLGAIAGFYFEGISWWHTLIAGEWTMKVWIGILELGIFSSGFAFLIQVRAQRYIPPSSVGLLALLESPWAMVFSVLILQEQLSAMQIIGAVLVLIAAVGESIGQAQIEKKKARAAA